MEYAETEAGASLLDRVSPGWAKRIDRSRLAMNSLYDCILGQLYGSYAEGLTALRLTEETARMYGFNRTPKPYETFAPFVASWNERIEQRLAA